MGSEPFSDRAFILFGNKVSVRGVPGVSTEAATYHQLIDLKSSDAGTADDDPSNGKCSDGEGTECERAKNNMLEALPFFLPLALPLI
jgi:hypothetical protein